MIKTTRLFIAMGKKDNMNKGRVVELITRKAGTKSEKITDVTVMDDFSFITVPSKEAKSILKFFRRTMKGQHPLVMKAKDDQITPHKKGGSRRFTKEKGRYIR